MRLAKLTTAFIFVFAIFALSAACGKTAPSSEYEGAGDRIGMTADMEIAPSYSAAEKAETLARKAAFPDIPYENDQWQNYVNGSGNYTYVILGDYCSYVVGEAGENVVIDNSQNVITIAQPGYYRFVGTLSCGSIVAEADGNVRIILDGVRLTGKDGAPIRFYNKGQKVVTFAEEKENIVSAPASVSDSNQNRENPSCAIYSESELTLNGKGTGEINGKKERAIVCRSTLKIKTVELEIRSKTDAVTAMNVVIKNTSLVIDSTAGSAIIAERYGFLTKEGYVVISDSDVRAVSAFDAISATDLVYVTGSDSFLSICSGNGSSSVLYDEIYSRKGIVSGGCVCIEEGGVYIDSLDDSIKCSGETLLSGGFLTASTKKTAVNSVLTEIKGGRTEIARSSVGIKGCRLSLSDGSVKITSNENGINLSAINGNDNACALVMKGGYVDVSTCGTCIKTDGKILVSGGSLWCDSSQAPSEPAVIANEGFRTDGGRIMIIAGLGMIQTPVKQSMQDSVTISFKRGISSHSTVSLKYDDVVLFSREVVNKVGSLFFTCPNFSRDYDCSLAINGSVVKKFRLSQTFTEKGVA
jgi:hypothetical protein